jgi:general secretion pathway protein A
MDESFYGFAEQPFSLLPDPRFLYRSDSHVRGAEILKYAISRREGYALITGDIGIGKTTLCRALAEAVDPRTFTALLPNPFLSDEDLLTAILQELGLVSAGMQWPAGRQPTKPDLIDALNEFLLSLVPLDARAVLIVDEAQNLPIPILEQIRILSNLETNKQKLLQIVLVGQPNLVPLLQSPELRQLDQRISVRHQLKPLKAEEIAAYVSHRVAIAKPARAVVFTDGAISRVYQCSGGVPRTVNTLCDGALFVGSRAQTTTIDEEQVTSAADALELRPVDQRKPTWFQRFLKRS